MLKGMTPSEKENWIKINQLIYLVKKNIFQAKELLNSSENALYSYFSSLSNTKLNQTHQKYINEINKEIWVDCYPYYFHFSEFIDKLNHQVTSYLQNNQKFSKFKKQLSIIQKKHFEGYSLELLVGIFWFTNDIIF
jgi:hypothetical protein